MGNFHSLAVKTLFLTLFVTGCFVPQPAEAQSYTIPSDGPNRYCPPPVTPLTQTTGTVISQISQLTTGGDTIISEGLVWAWRMLSPNWRGLWGETNMPLDYNTPHMKKAIVLLTDGKNEINFNNYTSYDGLRHNWTTTLYPIGRLSNRDNNQTNVYSYDNRIWRPSLASENLNTKTATLCTQIKGNDTEDSGDDRVLIYVIALDVNNQMGTATRTMLQNCASGNGFYFYAPSADDLRSIFDAIGDSLSNLRVSR